MKKSTAVLFTLVLPSVLACGSGKGGGSGGSCRSATGCGGDIEGTWEITSSCVTGDAGEFIVASMAEAGEVLPEACNNLFREFTVHMNGTMSFADGTMTTDATTTSVGKAHYTAACLAALSETQVATVSQAMCDGIEEELNSKSGDSATCSVKSGSCDCNVELAFKSTGTDAYTIAGSQLVDPAGKGSPLDFCVSGTTLTLSQTPASAANLSLVLTLRRK